MFCCLRYIYVDVNQSYISACPSQWITGYRWLQMWRTMKHEHLHMAGCLWNLSQSNRWKCGRCHNRQLSGQHSFWGSLSCVCRMASLTVIILIGDTYQPSVTSFLRHRELSNCLMPLPFLSDPIQSILCFVLALPDILTCLLFWTWSRLTHFKLARFLLFLVSASVLMCCLHPLC